MSRGMYANLDERLTMVPGAAVALCAKQITRQTARAAAVARVAQSLTEPARTGLCPLDSALAWQVLAPSVTWVYSDDHERIAIA
ncbi:hypothetical protein BH24CHL4_BH24CHL4_05360 [soil metagenome]